MTDGGELGVRLCGDLAIESNGQPLPATVMPGRQGRVVLAYLICARGRIVRREELADVLWPDRVPTSWTTSLSAVVSKLRRLLAAAGLDATTALTSSAAGYQLRLPDDAWIDWEVAQQAVERAELAVAAGDHASAASAAAAALEIAGRGFLSDACEWVDAQGDVARELCVRAVLAAAEAHLLAGSPARAVEAARDAVDRAPGREACYRLLMQALAANGERAEAMRVWERCRATLVDELGVDPSEETEAVYLEILGVAAQAPPAAHAELPTGVVTFLLTDIVESSAMWERDATSMAKALARHDALIAEVVALHGGTLLKTKLEGDATVSVFARATAGALGAVAVSEAVAIEPWPEGSAPVLRMALHTGEAFERDGDYFGPALNRAARLRALGSGGQILLSQAAAELVVDHLPKGVWLVDRGHRDLRGLSRGEDVSELTTVDPGAEAPTVEVRDRPVLRLPLPMPLVADSPFVGRDDQLARVGAAFDRARAGAPRAVLLAGEPGVGKSRLAAEWARQAHDGGAIVLYGRCDEGLGAPLQPFVECVRQLVPSLDAPRLDRVQGIEDVARVVPDLASLLPGRVPAPRADPDSERSVLFDALARLLTDVATDSPVVLVLDDLHWAGKTTLLLLRHLLRHAGSAPIFVLATYRDTELGRTHPLADVVADLHRDGTAERITLIGLSSDEVADYLRAVGHVDRALGAELAKVTAGNPFFLIETLRHVDESGGRWEPSTLPQGVREATGRRLSRLTDRANDMLHVAAVAGAVFPLELVEQICGSELVDEIAEACAAGLVLEEDGAAAQFRFAHALVRQVLLAELVTVKRVRLHRAIAELLESTSTTDPDIQLTELARHWFECAAAGDAEKAVVACRRAADRAMERLAFAEAAELYGMAAQAHPDAPDECADDVAELLVARCEALLAAGDAAPARAALGDLAPVTADSPRWQAWHATLAGQLAVVAEPDRLTELADGLRGAAASLRDAGDLRGEAKAHYVHALALERLGRIGAAEQALDRALSAARARGDRRLVDAVLASAPVAALWGPSPVTRASGRCLDAVRVLRITGGAPAVEAVALRCQAVLEALRGRIDPARSMVATARQTVDELGLATSVLETDVAAGQIELILGHPARAEAHLRPALDALRERGLDGEAARAAAMLGRALLAQGRIPEAESAAQEAAHLAGGDLRAGVVWRSVLAITAAAGGERDRALALAREAVELAAATDALLLEVDARMALASVLHAVGDEAAAAEETRRAADVCERKGATELVTRLRSGETGATGATEDGTTSPTPVRHVRENRASDWSHRATEALNAVGGTRFVELHADDCTCTHLGVELSREEFHAYLTRGATRAAAGSFTLLATLGPNLGLHQADFEVPIDEQSDWGSTRMENYGVFEVDDAGRTARVSLFALNQLGGAVLTLHEWFAETATAAEKVRASGVARTVAGWLAAHEDLVVENVLDLDLDHLVVIAEEDGRSRRTLHFAADGSLSSEDSSAAGGGSYVPVTGACGAPNLATEVHQRVADALNAGDTDAYLALAPLGSRLVTHDAGELSSEDAHQYRRGAPVTRANFTSVATLGRHFEVNLGTFDIAPQDQQGVAWGDARIENSAVMEVDDAGRIVRLSTYPVRQLGAAIATLYGWFAESVTGDERRRAVAAARAVGDWQQSHEDLVVEQVLELDLDHVVLVVSDDEGGGPDRVALDFAAGAPMMANAAWRSFASHSSGEIELVGTRGDGLALVREAAAGRTALVLVEVDEGDRALPTSRSDPDDLDAGFAALDERYLLTRASGRTYSFNEAGYNAGRGWGAVVDTLRMTPDLVFEDHRLTGFGILRSRQAFLAFKQSNEQLLSDIGIRALHIRESPWAGMAVVHQVGTLDVSGESAPFENVFVSIQAYDESGDVCHWHIFDETQIADALACYESLAAPSGEPEFANAAWWSFTASRPGDVELVATRGDRLALVRDTAEELSALVLVEVDEDGQERPAITWTADDLDAAIATLEERHRQTRDPRLPSGLDIEAAYNDVGWAAIADSLVLAPDLVFEDHRVLGFGIHRSRRELVDFIRSTEGLLSAVSAQQLHVRESPLARIVVVLVTGLVDAQVAGEALPFENVLVEVEEYDDSGDLCRRWDIYDESQTADALGRYQALVARAGEPEFANAAWRSFAASRPGTPEIVATRGDRLALVRDTDEEPPVLVLVELDEDGRARPWVTWTSDDLDAGLATLDERHRQTRDPRLPPRMGSTEAAYNEGGWGVVADAPVLAPDLVFEDHRITGFGIHRSRQAFVDFIHSTEGLLSEVRVKSLHVRETPRARIAVVLQTGTVDAGMTGEALPFENVFVQVEEYDEWGGECRKWDIYDQSHLADAFARYEALTDPTS